MAKAPNWTENEIEILKTEYPKCGCSAELLKLLPERNSTGIGIKARRLGISITNNPRRKRTNAEYLSLLNSTNFEALEEYSGSTVPILHRCKVCSHVWKTRPQHALRIGASCPICDHKNRCNSVEKVDRILAESGFKRLSDYTGALDKITLKHEYCGYEWSTVYSHVQQGSGCPICNKGFGYINQSVPEKATLYLLKIFHNNEVFLKIGVTVQPIKKRITAIRSRLGLCDIFIVHTVSDTGTNVLKKEAAILASFTKYNSKTRFEGYTECLDINNSTNLIIEVMNENV